MRDEENCKLQHVKCYCKLIIKYEPQEKNKCLMDTRKHTVQAL